MRAAALFWQALRRLLRHSGTELAGFIAYTVLVSLFPLIIFLFSLSSFFRQDILAEGLLVHLFSMLPAEVSDTLFPIIQDILDNERPGLLTLGIAGTLWAASAGVEAMRSGLNAAYELKETRPLWKRRLQAILLVFLFAFAGLVLSALIVLAPLAPAWMQDRFYVPLHLLTTLGIARYALGALILTVFLSVIYCVLPNHRRTLRDVIPGAAAACLLWMLLATLFSYYLENFGNYNVTYGSLGGVVITLLFLQFSAMIFLLGAEVNGVRLKSPLPSKWKGI